MSLYNIRILLGEEIKMRSVVKLILNQKKRLKLTHHDIYILFFSKWYLLLLGDNLGNIDGH